MSPITLVLSSLMVLIGVAMIVRAIAGGGGPLAVGIVLGLLFVAAGAGRHLRGTAAMSRDGRLHRLDPPEALKRGTGSPELFGIVQGLLSASMYFVLGVVVVNALGFSWLVYLVASLFFVLLVLSYMEGASLHQERGGATIIARYGFNELWSFVAGWAILLDYLILIAITAFATTDYAAVFWDQLAHGAPELILAIGVIAYVAFVNSPRARLQALGCARPTRWPPTWSSSCHRAARASRSSSSPTCSPTPRGVAGTPSLEDGLFAFTLSIAAFSGLDASSALAGEVAVSRKGLRRLLAVRVPAAVVPYIGIGLVASATLPQTGRQWEEAPMVGIVSAFDEAWLREPLRYLVAICAHHRARDRLQRRHVRPRAAGELARGQPPDPVARRPPAPDLRHAGRADRARRAARRRARAAHRPRVPRRDLRLRRDARVHRSSTSR